MKVFIISLVCLAVHLTFGVLSIIRTVKYYKQENWDFNNEDAGIFIGYLFVGFAGFLATLATYHLKGNTGK